ncbi:very short patch repair endonuclease [Streptomyces sp. NPDC051994]|uniref:very short patch repair endonuclease n=1 Tax=unclassified Streptomyces TaxID=2593676 RepID=UPI0034165A59
MSGGASAGQWVSTTKSEHLRGRRTRDTKPEVALRKAVHRLGLRYRLQRRVARRCTADFVLPRYRIAVFVDGCFWHGCPEHCPDEFQGPNAALWQEKITANRERDQRNTIEATATGWIVVRIWECEIRRDTIAATRRVATLARVQGGSVRSRSTANQGLRTRRSNQSKPST